ncbi:23S rRNA (pseudouridine(1915)-N(3))-methyltransferase RlmH [Limnobacter humi]|uniref:Ribosomal RNA large subunit methyltransferase H n=1 Tax=Limnobacter humi TaxID=1778671 RepID=A0ABT1WC89_9BURK|nr:23S rRNA (pseudouridine(1915)-N(3))-methyltransferase RlmH [Limnobacter humi]MCQ8895128.1 23S rRNA (pseudouridine(1915)-N(3))-methyltransferase RlmH [Limnobacter humi]
MKITIIALSHKIEPWAQQAVEQFQKRFPADWKLTIKELKPEDRSAGKAVDQILAKEADRIRAAIPTGSKVVALDERGERLTSKALSDQLLKWHNASEQLTLLIGSADGLDSQLKAQCHALWRISDLTLPHAMVRALLVEALYRAWSIQAGHPYHRE